MKIEWKIEKKRGNFRPTLSYSFVIEKFEKALALPPVRILSSIAEPLDSFDEHCYPNQHERAGEPIYKGFYTLTIVSHKGSAWPQKIRLPWREDNNYPEVEESFALLREAYEQELALANESLPMQESASMQISDKANAALAPNVLAEKFLHFAKRSSNLDLQADCI